MTRIQCNVCGEDTIDKKVHIEIEIHKPIGYGSKYDGDRIDLDVCANCVDVVLEAISRVCKIPPVHIVEEIESKW